VAKQNSMIENFTFTLKNNKAKLLKRVTWIWYFILLGLIALFAFSENVESKEQKKLLIGAALLIGASAFYNFLNKTEKEFKRFQMLLFFISASNISIFFGLYFAICFLLFTLFIYWFSLQKTTLFFTTEKIMLKNGFFKRFIDWSNLNNVVLKDGILSLDFKNDKLIQEEVEGEIVNEEEFATFLHNQF
jgi:hypothetical protein